MKVYRCIGGARVSNMPPLLQNFILMVFPFYRTLLSCLEAEKSVRIDFILQSAIISYQSLNSTALQISFVAPISWNHTIVTLVFGDNFGKRSTITFLPAHWRKYFGCRIWIQKDDDIFNQHSWTKYKIRVIHLGILSRKEKKWNMSNITIPDISHDRHHRRWCTFFKLVYFNQVGRLHADSFWKRYFESFGRGYLLQRFDFCLKVFLGSLILKAHRLCHN